MERTDQNQSCEGLQNKLSNITWWVYHIGMALGNDNITPNIFI